VVRHLFVVDDVDVAARQIPAALRPYCLYEHPTTGHDLTWMVPRLLSAVERDCLATGAAGGTLEEQTWAELSKQLLITAGSTRFTSATGRPPRLVIIDTQPTYESDPDRFPGRSPHGYSLANMARELLCTPSSGVCTADLGSELALPYISFDLADGSRSARDEKDGGYVGSLGDLATAVFEAVRRWQDNDPTQHLVLHLAVAWDGSLFGGLEASYQRMPIPARVVFLAIRDAVCRGALVVAAAGNSAGGPSPEDGPMLPAAWEMLAAPDGQVCEAAGAAPADAPPSRSSLPIDRPMLWAAGGITSSGEPLANSRHEGLPRCVAVADHAVVESHLPGVPTATLTGSSVATTVVASTAAAVWYLRPELDRFAVMDLVYHSGDDLGVQADFCTGSPDGCVIGSQPQSRRRISVCRAVALACSSGAGACADQAPVSCPIWVPGLPKIPIDLSSFADADLLTLVGDRWIPAGPLSACVPLTVAYNPETSPPEDPCPQSQYHGLEATPWVGPQPGSNPCPNCLMSLSQGVVLLEIDSGFRGVLKSLSLQVDGATYSLAPGHFGGAALISLRNVGISSSSVVSVSFAAGGSSSATSPLLVAY
jgi:hypothetical protein